MTTSLGAMGEEVAVRHLEALGYRVVARNYRCQRGEIDCVAVDRGTLVFVEVKARRTAHYGGPLEAVDARKRRRMTRAARQFVHDHRLGDVAQRFDFVAVWIEAGPPRVELFRNAFEAEP